MATTNSNRGIETTDCDCCGLTYEGFRGTIRSYKDAYHQVAWTREHTSRRVVLAHWAACKREEWAYHVETCGLVCDELEDDAFDAADFADDDFDYDYAATEAGATGQMVAPVSAADELEDAPATKCAASSSSAPDQRTETRTLGAPIMAAFRSLPAAVLAYLALALTPCFDRRRYFASGSNRAGEIRGLSISGCDFGVAAPEMMSEAAGVVAPRDAMGELVAAAARGVSVFVDSGAFSEMCFHGKTCTCGAGGGAPVVVRPMGDIEWRRVFACYRIAAEAYGARAYLVAPDRVASQDVTLERQARYAPQVRELVELGARILVPVQKGAVDMATFYRAELDALGLDEADAIPALPMKKDATRLEDAVAFVAAVKPARVHLLGLGPKRRREKGAPSYGDIVAALEAASPSTEIICDSVLMSSIAGRGNGRKCAGGRRALTVAMDVVGMANLELRDDTARRALAIRMLADMARPAAVVALRVAS